MWVIAMEKEAEALYVSRWEQTVRESAEMERECNVLTYTIVKKS